MDGVALVGHHCIPDTIVKKGPKSPSQPTTRKHKTFSATTGEPIGYIDVIDEDPTTSMQACRKRTQTMAGREPQVKVEEVVVPKAARKSTWTVRGSMKSDMGELYRRLGQELAVVAKTFEDIVDNMD